MNKKLKLKVTYNAPVTLTFVIMCAFILLIDQTLLHGKFVPSFLTAPARSGVEGGFNPSAAGHYIRLFVHVLGHTDINHLIGNLSFILLLGPLLEERYGSKMICLMILVTALVTGVINSCLIPSQLCGASGIVFMMIVLASITTIEKNVIPLSFIFVVVLFLGRELFATSVPKTESVSTVAHIAGGLCGSLFGFLVAPKAVRKSSKKPKSVSIKDTEKEREEEEEKSSGKSSSVIEQWREKRKRLEELDSQSPRFKGYGKETEIEEIGTIEL